VTAVGVLRSEWLKLRSVRSSTTALASSAAVLLFVGLIFSAIVGGVISGRSRPPVRSSTRPGRPCPGPCWPS
jgi:hypothetical protein